MRSLNSFADHVSRLSTHAVEARTYGFHSLTFRPTGWQASPNPTKFLFSNPSLLSAGRSYPNFAGAASVNDRQAPLGFQVKHIAVGDELGSKGIYNFNRISSQDKFGFNPKTVNKKAENCADDQVADDFKIVLDYPQTIDGEKCNQNIRSNRPSKVALGSKRFAHHLIITGERT